MLPLVQQFGQEQEQERAVGGVSPELNLLGYFLNYPSKKKLKIKFIGVTAGDSAVLPRPLVHRTYGLHIKGAFSSLLVMPGSFGGGTRPQMRPQPHHTQLGKGLLLPAPFVPLVPR